MSYTELQTLIAAAQAKATEQRQADLADAVEVAKAELGKRGFTIGDLIAFVDTTNEPGKGKGRKSRSDGGKKVAPKYRNPANAEETWTGRGIKPKWLAAKLAAGAKVEDFAINQ
jgi:DNA-binding protein H-NS